MYYFIMYNIFLSVSLNLKRLNTLFLCFLVIFIASACSFGLVAQTSGIYSIRVNQVGYLKGEKKLASVVSSGQFGNFEYSILEKSTQKVVSKGTVSNPTFWPPSKEYVFNIDFSTLDKTGQYTIVTPSAQQDIIISKKTYAAIGKAAIKYYYFNRASMILVPKYAGVYARPSGHPETNVLVHASAASDKRPEGTPLQCPKGWYDAGDYNKYIVNSGISTYTLLAAYEHYPDYYAKLALDIPEKGGKIPDLLDEVLWNIDWMLTMQDPNDGGVYHKCTDKEFCGEIMPHQTYAQRYVVQKSTAAALNFAAVMAVGARVFAPFEKTRPDFSARLQRAAIAAYQWAKAHPGQYYMQPDDIKTGGYGDNNVEDEFLWAAAELLITTKDAQFAKDIDVEKMGGIASWNDVAPLAAISLSFHQAALRGILPPAKVKVPILAMADSLRFAMKTAGMGVAMGQSNADFVWGSNAQAANQIIVLIRAYEISLDRTYLEAAYQAMDYLLGRNGTGYCYVTGFGTQSPHNPHHRPSQADLIKDPVPGMLVGGPNPGQQDGCKGYSNNFPASSYLDNWCSYASNEVAINWNAPLVYALNALEYYHETKPVRRKKRVQKVPF